MDSSQTSPTFGLQASGATPPPAPEVANTPMENADSAEGFHEDSARTYADKYNSVEDLESGYKELQKKLSERAPDTSELSVDQIVERAGLNGGDLVTNWQTDGKLSDAQYESFAKTGISKNMIDSYLHGQTAIAQNGSYAQEKIQSEAAELAGGQKEFANLMNWATENYPQDKQESLNVLLEDPAQWRTAVKEMMWDWKMESGRGFTQPLIQGQSMPNTSSGFETVGELLGAMAQIRRSGKPDESFKRRLSNTSQQIIQGIE